MTFTSNFSEAFDQSRGALDDFLKNGPLPTDDLRTWDKELKQFIVYQGHVRDNPGKTFTKAKLFPNEFNMHSRSPPLITLDGDQGPPPMPNSEPKKTRPPLPSNPSPKTPPKPMSPKVASSIPDLQPPPKMIQPKLGAVAKTRTVSKPRLAYSESP